MGRGNERKRQREIERKKDRKSRYREGEKKRR
jgi:hypothetical protein